MGAAAEPSYFAVFLPLLVRTYLVVRPEVPYAFCLTVLYLILAAGAVAVISLWVLLMYVRRKKVFTRVPVRCLRILSWCCIWAGIAFGVLGIYFTFSFLVAAAALFLGLILRVVKNCLEEASILKEENDYTI